MDRVGKIHSIETCGTVDGPGVRYVLFLSGCPLRCKYCHNPDTWAGKSNFEMTVSEVMKDLISYKEYFGRKGGLTVSGGEATLQTEFVKELFKECKKENIHTCLDTSGYCNIDSVKELLEYTDLILLDIKQMDPEKHRKLTGVRNEKILEFAKYLEKENIDTWIRYVLVPGHTDDMDDVDKLKNFIKDMDNVKKVEVLPYHRLGVEKWNQLGLDYQLEGVLEPSEESVEKVSALLNDRGKICSFKIA
ncbi:MAG: pyruvate formate-lyase-activating protein [Firmicutes bacterium]|jgi:pyruvate formate lyase activating enzyme|nr:pyruvate formate-lyase-activating protein [Bacillota bacterium]